MRGTRTLHYSRGLGTWSISLPLPLSLTLFVSVSIRLMGQAQQRKCFNQYRLPSLSITQTASYSSWLWCAHTCTHIHAQMFIWLHSFPLVFWCKVRPQVVMLSGCELLNPVLFSLTLLPSSRDLISCLSMLPARFLSWILNDPFWMKWMKHNRLSVSGTSVPKLRLELQLRVEVRNDLSHVGLLPERQRHSVVSPWPTVSLLQSPFVLRNI